MGNLIHGPNIQICSDTLHESRVMSYKVFYHIYEPLKVFRQQYEQTSTRIGDSKNKEKQQYNLEGATNIIKRTNLNL